MTRLLKNISLSHILRVFVLCAVLVCGSAAWGTNYTWTGGGTDTNWTTAANWGGSGYPSNSSDTATFTGASAATVKLDSSVTVGTITTNTGGTSLITINTNGYTLTCSSMLLNQTATATFDANVSITSLTVTSNASVTVASGGTLTANNIACTGNSRITATDGAVVFGYNGATAASWSATYPSYSQFGTVTVSSGCTLTSASDMYISGSWTNNGTFTDTSHTVYFIPSSSSSIGGSGSTTFYGLNCTSAGGKTLSINSTIAVTTLTLTGTSSASRLTIDGTNGQINLASSQTTGNYLTIDTTNVNVADTSGTVSGSTYTSANSSDDSGKAAAKNGWIFLVENAVWIGGTATGSVYSWDTVGNWQDGIEPTADSAVTYSAAATTSPTLASDVSVKSIAVPSGMSLDLVNHTLTVSENFSDAGELSLYGTSADQLNVTGTKTIGTKVTYYGGGTSFPIRGITLYADLSVSGSGTTLTTTGDVTISGTLTNSGTVAVAANTLSFASYSGTSDTVTVTAGGTITQSGGSASSTIGTLTMTSATGKAVVLNGPTGSAYNLAVTNATYSSADVTTTGYVSLPAGIAGALTVSNDALSITGDFTITGNAQFNGTVSGTGVLTINGTSAINTTAITTVGAQTYRDAVTIGADTTFTSSSGTGTITFAAIDDSAVSSHTVTVVTKNTGTTDAVVFGGAVGGSKALKSLSVTATTITMSATTVNASTQVYTGAVTTSSSATTLTGAVTNNGGFTCGGDVTITGTLTNNSTFTCGGVTKITGTVTNAGTITGAAGLLTFGGAVTNSADSNAITSGTGGITFNDSITGGVLNGNIGITITVDNSSAASFAPNTFTNNGCAFVLAGSGAVTIGGEYTFNTFSCVTPGAAKTISFKGGSVTKADSFTVTGESGKLISLQSDTSGTKWYLNAATTNVSVSYAKITDSEAYDVLITKTANSTDGGNTVNWFSASYTWKGTSDSNWSTIANWLITGTTRVPTVVPISNNSSVDIIVDNGANNALVLGTAAASNPAGGTGGLITLNSLTVNASASLSINGRNITAAKVTNNGSVTLSGSEALTFTSLTTNAATSTVTYNGASAVSVNFKQNGSPAVTYNNLVVSGTYDGSTAKDTTLQLDSVTVTVSGTLTNYGVIEVNDSGSVSKTDSARGKFVYSTAAHTITDYTSTAGEYDYYDLTIDSSGYIQMAGGALAVKNNLAVTAGTFACDSHAVTVGGTMTNAGTTAVGTGSFTAKSTTSNTGTISLGTGTVTFTGDYTSTSAASLKETGAGSIYFLGAANLTNNTFTCGTGTVYLNGSSVQTLTTNDQSFYNVTLSNTVSTAVTVSGSMKVTGTLTVGANSTLDLAANNVALSVTGATVNNGTISGNTLNATPAAMTFSGAYSGTSGTLSATKGTTTFGANADLISTTFTNNGGAVVFNGTTQTLTIGANSKTFNSIALNATTSFTLADGTNALAAVTVTDAGGSESITLNASVTVTNAVTFNTTGTVTLGNDASDSFTFGSGVTATAPSSKTVAGTITATANNIDFGTTATTVAAVTKFDGSASGTITLGDVALASGVTLTAGAAADSNSITLGKITPASDSNGTVAVVNAGGAVSFTGDIGTSSLYLGTLTLSKTGGSVTFADGKAVYASTFTPAAGAYAVVMNSNTAAVKNAVTFANTGTLTLGNSASDSFTFGSGVTATAPSSKTVAGTITATANNIDFGTTATTVAAVTKFDGSASGTITLGDVALASGVTLTAGAAADSNSITFGKITPASNSNGTVAVVNAAGDVSFTGDIGTSSLYLGTLTLSKTGGSVTFADGKAVYASTFTPAAGAYAVVMNSNTAAVTNAVTFANTGTLTLGNSASDSFTFDSGVTATAPSSKTVAGIITATANNIDFGTTATTASAEIHLVSNAGSINTASLSSAAGLLVVTAGAAASFNGAVSQTYTTGTFSVTAGTSVKFGSTVSSTGDISVSANSGSGTITANGNISASAGNITLTGNVILSSNAVFSVNTLGTNTVTITGKLDASAADAQGLEIDTGTGAITLGEAIGGIVKLKYLYLNTKQTSEFTIPVIKGVTTVKISTCGKVGQSGAIIGTGLYIKTLAAAGSGTITLYNSGNDFDNIILAALSADGKAPVASYISYQDSDGFAIASDSSFLSTVTAYSSAGIISSGIVTLCSGGAVTQTGIIAIPAPGSLLLMGAGPYTMESGNSISAVAGKVTAGNVTVNDTISVAVTTVASGHDSAITADGITLTNSGSSLKITDNSSIVLLKDVVTNAGAVTLDGSVSVSGTGTVTVSSGSGAGDIDFTNTVDGNSDYANPFTVNAGTGKVTFEKSVGSSRGIGTCSVSAEGGITAEGRFIADSLIFAASSSTEIALYGNITTNKKAAQFNTPVVLYNDIQITTGAGDATGAVIFTSTVSGSGKNLAIEAAKGNITFGGDVGTLSAPLGAVAVSSATDITTGTGKSMFVSSFTQSDGYGTTTLGPVTATAAVSVSTVNIAFGGTVKAPSGITATASGTITAAQPLITGTGNIAVNSTGTTTFSSAADITTAGGNVVFGDTSHTGTFTTAGSITTGNGTVLCNNPVVLSDSISVSAGTGTVTFAKAVSSSGTSCSLTVASSGALTFSNTLALTGNITQTDAATGATLFGNTVSCASADLNGTSYQFNGKINSSGAVTITNTSLLLTAEDADFALASGNFTQDGTGDVQLAGGITTAGTGAVSFASDVYLYGGDTDGMQLGGGSGAITVGASGNKDLHIAASTVSKTITVSSALKARNIALYGGTLNLSADVAANKDIILLSGNPSSMYADSSTGLATLYAYNTAAAPARAGTVSPSLSAFPAIYPDGSAFITVYCGAVEGSSLNGRTVTAGQNFYDDGVSLEGTSVWYLRIKTNDSALNAFAEIYNAAVAYCSVSATESGKYAWLAAGENCTNDGNNTNIAFSRPLLLLNDSAKSRGTDTAVNLSGTYTVYDDVVRVEFYDSVSGTGTPLKIENSNNEISAAVANIKLHTGTVAFSGSYVNADCTTTTDGAGDISVFYLKTSENERWNTDATGISAGNAQSTDRGRSDTDMPAHRNIIPDIEIPKALAGVYQTLRDEHKNRIRHYYGTESDASGSEGKIFAGTADRASPVLIAAYTGQETHTKYDSVKGADSQPSYDAHNFIEFQYSEPVNIGDMKYDGGDVNLRAQTAFGSSSAHGGSIEANGTGLTVTGFAEIASGELSAGNRTTGNTDTTVSSLYRTFAVNSNDTASVQTHRVRISAAGYADGTITTNGTAYRNWIGYIDSSKTPSGEITSVSNEYIYDASGNSVPLESYASALVAVNHKLVKPVINEYVSSTDGTCYGAWDTSVPVFAPFRSSLSELKWTEMANPSAYEAVGTGPTGSTTLDRIEFHVFDNSPAYSSSDAFVWYSKRGWTTYDSPDTLYTSYSYAADIFGGSRPFDADSTRRTSGGVRVSSVYKSASSFKYAIGAGKTPSVLFGASDTTSGAKGTLFITANDTYNASDSADSLYFAVYLDITTLSMNTTFTVSYDGSGYITDLAGNRMKAATINTVDRTPPKFSFSAVPVGTKFIYVLFDKLLNVNDFSYIDNSGNKTTLNGLESLPKGLELVSTTTGATATGIAIDQTVPAVKVFSNEHFTGVMMQLTQNATLSDIENVYVRVKNVGTSTDPVTGITNSFVSYIQDETGNYMKLFDAHAFSDFAVNAVQPEYAYDSSLTDEESASNIKSALTDESSWAVHDWNAEQRNYGTLLAGYDIFVHAKLISGKKNSSGNDDYTDTDGMAGNVRMYLDNNPSADSIADTYNDNTGYSLRVWIPNVTTDIFEAFSEANNPLSSHLLQQDGVKETSDLSSIGFTLGYTEKISAAGWTAGDQIKFLFGIMSASDASVPVYIRHSPEYTGDSTGGTYSGTQYPLYALRLRSSVGLSDTLESAGKKIASGLDLWSFRLKNITLQRGGVTILNNVINVNGNEDTVVEVDTPSSGSLSVIVMTLDGNIIKYLQHGKVAAGKHVYKWNGRNGNGNAVARGLYFIRVFGNGIDETRKVMCVKQ